MSYSLVVCAGCYRHVRASERACPFCRAALDAPPPASRPGALHTAVIAAALAMAATDRAHAQQNPLESPRFGLLHGGAEGYGAPPAPTVMPVRERPPAPPEHHVEQQMPQEHATLFEFARQPLPPQGHRPHADAPWQVALSIHADGSWVSGARSGRLDAGAMATLRSAVERASLSRDAEEPHRAWPERAPTVVQRVTVGARSMSWLGSEAPRSRDARHLIELAYRLTRTRP